METYDTKNEAKIRKAEIELKEKKRRYYRIEL